MSLELTRAKHQLTRATLWRVMNVIEEKTIGYGKWSDDIAMSQFEQLSGLRDDKIYAALKELEDFGLILTERGKFGRIVTIHPNFQSRRKSKKNSSTPPKSGSDLPPDQGKNDTQTRGTTINTITYNTTTTVQHAESAPENGGGELSTSPLTYPETIKPEERQAAIKQLDGIQPKAAQDILTLWQHAIANNKIKSSVVGYLVGLVKRFRSGTLEPLRSVGAEVVSSTGYKPSFGILKQGAEDTPAARQAHDAMLAKLLKQSGNAGELAWV